tara:strand:+ start:2516 stop:2707 length:192 start_codon:yes stop_codon:yes gene_type:complete
MKIKIETNMSKDFTDFFMDMIQSQKVKKSYTKKELKILEQEFLKVYFKKVKSEKIKPRKKLKI